MGITYVAEDGSVVDECQVHGTVLAVDPLVTIDQGDDDPFTLPPDPQAFDRAAPGHYHLRSTGETVVDPAFLSTWTVRAPAS